MPKQNYKIIGTSLIFFTIEAIRIGYISFFINLKK